MELIVMLIPTIYSQVVELIFNIGSMTISLFQALAPIISAILTAVLAGLYYQQYKVLRVNQEPSIEMADFNIEGDELEIYLTNYGQGLAKNLRVQTRVKLPIDGNVNPDIDGHEHEEVKVMSLERRLQRHEGDRRLRERAIMGQEKQVKFQGEPAFPVSDDAGYAGFNSGVCELFRRGTTEFIFNLEVVYDSQLGATDSVPLFSSERWVNFDEQDAIELVNTQPSEVTLERMYERSGLAPYRR